MQSKIKINPQVIRRAVERAPSTSKAVWNIHRYVLSLARVPWRNVKAFNGYVLTSKQTWLEICRAFIARDNQDNAGRDIREQVMAGGAWLNWGFSCHEEQAKELKHWEVTLPPLEME